MSNFSSPSFDPAFDLDVDAQTNQLPWNQPAPVSIQTPLQIVSYDVDQYCDDDDQFDCDDFWQE